VNPDIRAKNASNNVVVSQNENDNDNDNDNENRNDADADADARARNFNGNLNVGVNEAENANAAQNGNSPVNTDTNTNSGSNTSSNSNGNENNNLPPPEFAGQGVCASFGGTFSLSQFGNVVWVCNDLPLSADPEARTDALSDACVTDGGDFLFREDPGAPGEDDFCQTFI